MRRKARPGGGRQAEVVIESIGGRGDGVGHLDGVSGSRPVFVSGTLPGDRVRLRLTGERAGGYKAALIELLEAGPGRVAPPCPHFGPCGGCALQHWHDGRYAAWKHDLAVLALARRGFEAVPVRPLVRIPPGTRRRASLAAHLAKDGSVRLGFHARESHDIVDLRTCLLLTPALLGLLEPLRAMLSSLLRAGDSAQIVVTETDAGLDVLIATRGAPDLSRREALSRFADDLDLARLSWREPDREPEPIAIRRPPVVAFCGVAVTPPPGGFLQPTREGEAALQRTVVDALPGTAARVVDLFAGCGTFTFAMATQGGGNDLRVHAVEGDSAASESLRAAASQAQLTGRVGTEVRDLAQRPLLADELAIYDAVVFDPPRVGAKAQAEQIASSGVPSVVAVSCNPNSFTRDARILADGGYLLCEITPIDQFPWSGHLELVAVFTR